ncbi:rhodanese-like domain-containing protein [Fulvivirga ligni]|uniref:rhodanese-like domain-containing protein n=1 Tax=Fulvivirga ligni TaxID=2904246 RepID=UPI001F1A1A8C|nr:rhodanese-like domain-containing protein [Fulvivirga ligni]UII20250.1 rhodanese-like domain-containing protein [Fulvivirga ligni]
MFSIFKNIMNSTDNESLKEAINNGALLVDVRTPGEFAGGSVRGAVNIPLDQVANQLSKFKGKDQIVVFCQSGNRSGQAHHILESNGFDNVMNGGSWYNVNKLVN